MGWLQKILISRWVKGILDKLPGNGFKSAIGILLIVLGAIGSAKPEYAGMINWVIDLLKPYASEITDAGIVSVVIGVVHKIIKWITGRAQ